LSLPGQIETAIEDAISHFTGILRVAVIGSDTHRAILVTGWNDDTSSRRAIAHYLVGLLACAIDAALNIRAQLADTPEDRDEILQNVLAKVGTCHDSLTADQKEDERNPWIAEGIWHLCLAVAAHRGDLHPIGTIVALDYAHVAAKDHGLDVAAIYEARQGFGLTLVESKAYRNNPNGAISDAVEFFKKVDSGKHAVRIRQSVQIMRTALPAERQQVISASFWKQTRSYMPNPHYDAASNPDWSNARSSFRALQPDRDNIVIMPHPIHGFDEFFDEVAEEMRDFAGSLQPCTTNMPGS
jgi:hypothetical protein